MPRLEKGDELDTPTIELPRYGFTCPSLDKSGVIRRNHWIGKATVDITILHQRTRHREGVVLRCVVDPTARDNHDDDE